MPRLVLITLSLMSAFLCVAGMPARAADQTAERPPNFVIIFTDDQGWADVGVFGAKDIATPNLDRMAAEGMRFTDFYVSQAVCSSSRTALMTGCYPNRVGIVGALTPHSKIGINDHEMLIPQVLKPRGYATAIYGKWHLGDSPQFLPTRHGFDDYFGLPYSNDMHPGHPTTKFPPLPLIEGEKTIQFDPDQHNLTTWYTEHAIKFIEANKDKPFFLYVPHNMPHVPLHVSSKFAGKSGRGLYGDVIMEVDWSVGQILGALKSNGLDDKTLVMFASDNGPWLLYGDHGGRALPLREGKATEFDGGVRTPCIMRWPGKIPAGQVCHEMGWTMDILPTFAKLAGAEVPNDRIIDGKDIWPMISGQPNAKTPHEVYYYYWLKELQAVRSGKWKLHVPHDYTKPNPPGHGGLPGKYDTLPIGLSLFDLENDISESQDVAAEHPDVVKKLQEYVEQARADLGDSKTKRTGKNVREPGKVTETGQTSDEPAPSHQAVVAREALD